MRWRLCRLLRYRTASLIPVLRAGLDPVTAFPPIRVFWYGGVHCRHVGSKPAASGIGSLQYIASGASLLLSAYALDFAEDSGCGKKRLHRLPASWVWMPSCCLNPRMAIFFPLRHDAGRGAANYQRFLATRSCMISPVILGLLIASVKYPSICCQFHRWLKSVSF